MVRIAIALLLAAVLSSPALAGTVRKPKMCGVYARYVCGTTGPAKKVKAKAKICGVYVKYSC
jgi:hypothetical protein